MMMLRVIGFFLIAMGIIWALQGAGWLNWPADSFMLGDVFWARLGTATAGAGAALVGIVQYRKRP
ncbi:MAG: hypothetical protein GW858_03265 [Sphingomonadales bacterium]|nr:hypothetical protein [Sphingomonadales bacterium]NCQ20869.1 hypothetical protein [Sphingomonadales bacterium]NCT02626.1 hypothetical protein [Sphingomonadales bacterium]